MSTSRTSAEPHGQSEDRRLTRAVAGSLLIVATGGFTQLLNYALDLGTGPLDSSMDGGIFGVVGDVAAAAAAAASWLALIRLRPRTPAIVGAPPLLTFIALDKVLRLHDHIPQYLVVYAPLLVGAFVCLVRITRRLPPSEARVLWFGLALLALSFALHLVGEQILLRTGLEGSAWATQVKAVVKHGSELEGWLLICIGLTLGSVDRPPSKGLGTRLVKRMAAVRRRSDRAVHADRSGCASTDKQEAGS
jgi:hypothetical protein